MTIRDQKLVCDQCQTVITRISTVPGEGWAPAQHNLCSKCFRELKATSINPA
ncbi:MAG TPA: hypothetical protein VMG36_03810 [Thermoplasmata archaeon]|nr:hypothetical protein [Thermoplasmata archaeon]